MKILERKTGDEILEGQTRWKYWRGKLDGTTGEES